MWVDQGTLFFGTRAAQTELNAPERIHEVWLGANHVVALASGETALWRVELQSDAGDKVAGMENLTPEDKPPISRSSANLAIAPHDSYAAAMIAGELWRIPLTWGEPAQKLATMSYPGRGGRINAPAPLAGSPYWYPGELLFNPDQEPPARPVLLDTRDGSFVPVSDILADAGVEMVPASQPQVAPDGRWLSVPLAEAGSTLGASTIALYLVPSTDLTGGRVVNGTSLLAWQSAPAAAIVHDKTEGAILRVPLPDGEPVALVSGLGAEGTLAAKATSDAIFVLENARAWAFAPDGTEMASTELPAAIGRLETAQGQRLTLTTGQFGMRTPSNELWIWDVSGTATKVNCVDVEPFAPGCLDQQAPTALQSSVDFVGIVPGVDAATAVSWSPDGQKLAYA